MTEVTEEEINSQEENDKEVKTDTVPSYVLKDDEMIYKKGLKSSVLGFYAYWPIIQDTTYSYMGVIPDAFKKITGLEFMPDHIIIDSNNVVAFINEEEARIDFDSPYPLYENGHPFI